MALTAAQKRAAAAKKKAAAAKPKPKTYADYGYVSGFLSAHTDVKKKVDQAIKEGWTPDRLQGEIKTTSWWKNRTESQRQYDMGSVEQKAEYDKKVADQKADILSQASRMGVTISATQAQNLALQMVRDGKSQQEALLYLANTVTLPAPGGAEKPMQGQAAVTVDEIRQMAAEYGVSLSNADLLKKTQQVLGGQMDVAGIEDSFRESAKALYAPLADILDKGTTLKQFVSPYLNIASQQLGIPNEMMDLSDSKWTGMIQQGKVLTADEWTRTLRTDAQYGWSKTEGAKREAMGLVSSLGQMFGSA